MTEPRPADSRHGGPDAERRLRRRHAAERRFQRAGAGAIGVALAALVLLLASITWRALPAFWQYEIRLTVDLTPATLGLPDGWEKEDLSRADFQAPVRESLRERFPDVTDRRARRDLYALVSSGASFDLRDRVVADPDLVGGTFELTAPLADDADLFFKSDRSEGGSAGRLSEDQVGWLRALEADGRIARVFDTRFFTAGDSREPELAGIRGALVGSLWTLGVTLLLCFPLGVASAIYLEEFAPKNRITDLIEVNINNLAAVPSIVFGLLGLAVFLNFLGLPRSAPLVGGIVLALMTLPTVIIAGRSALMAVPPSIREAALGMGASPLQVVSHHVLPLAMPGILTGTIIGMARALGETAPLLMIGMVAFIVDIPSGPTAPATVLPVQIYLWADSPERAFVAKTSAAILVLLGFLVVMNLSAVILRNRTERRW